jgi:hypothetical protein
MVREAYPAGGPPQLADNNASSAANLTQELAQLLAQSIAQGQAGKRPPGAAATGSELASLAALVSASQNQRQPQPYKDGLSSLSYTRPPHSPPPALTPTLAPVLAPVPTAPSSSGGMLITEPHHDDEPMPIPSTWRQPMLSDDDRWYRQQLGAAALGLIAGLIVVVPAVLWLSGFLGGPQKGPRPAVAETPPAVTMATADATPDVKVTIADVKKITDIRPRKTDEQPTERTAAAPPPRRDVQPEAPPPPKVDAAKVRMEELLSKAKRRISSGDIKGAREILRAPEAASSGPMTFMLAETYDPNMLASWDIMKRDVADRHKARNLYQKALALGEAQAERRLRPEWLGN